MTRSAWPWRSPIRPLSSHPPTPRLDAENFSGDERFRVKRRLGAGAFGVVFEAWDERDRRTVAIKVLRIAEADALYRFKKSFRSLTDIRHPNLVAFYELLTREDRWLVTMELVHGIDFLEYVRGAPWNNPSGGENSRTSITSTVIEPIPPLDPNLPSAPISAQLDDADRVDPDRVDPDRVRRALVQLTHGLAALHGHGRLHRDIKPSNLLVTGEDRLVLLDFGLVAELTPVDVDGSKTSSHLVGTPIYMAPEQALGIAPLPANDWYSVGVMLFQALTGRLPFQGSIVQVLSRKQVDDPPDVREFDAAIPDDLAEITRRLLDRDVDTRLDGTDILRRLAAWDAGDRHRAETAAAALAERAAAGPGEPIFIGRRQALDALEDAYQASSFAAVTLFVRGASGIGKSALVQHFLHDLEKGGGGRHGAPPVVLAGRCYPQESVPYKALDSLIDSLSRILLHLPKHEVEVLLPVHVAALARVFPVLRRVPAVAEARTRWSEDSSDQQALRRRAFAALRDLLTRLADRRNLVLAIDDLQWGDFDSLELLAEVLAPPDPPPLLLIGVYRREDAESPFVRALGEHRASLAERGLEVRELELDELPADEAAELVRRLAGGRDDLPGDRVGQVLREAGGSPFFLTELARSAREITQDAEGDRELLLRDVLEHRIGALPDAARRLLAVLAVAGRPLHLSVAARAAQLDDPAAAGDLAELLRTEHLLRRRADDGDEQWIEPYHDRIRETLIENLPEEALRELHGHLASILERASGGADPEILANHFHAAGESDRAYHYALAAAEQAEEALAFARAADLYAAALRLHQREHGERYQLQARLAAALAHAGRSYDAAEAYLEAVGHSGNFDPFDLQRAAAEKLLMSGHIDRGLAVLRHVLRTVGMHLETRPFKALIDLRLLRLALRLRGWSFEERSADAVDPEELRRIDVCWSGEIGLCQVDLLLASQLHARHLWWALGAGEPRRIARGLALEIFFGAIEGRPENEAADLAHQLVARLDDDNTLSLIEMAAGMRACLEGRWEDARVELRSAEQRLHEPRPGNVSWELDTVLCFRLLADLQTGRWPELFDELPRLLKTSRERGDLYLEVHLRQWVESLRQLADDAPERAAEAVGKAIERWSQHGFHYQHFGHLVAAVQIALYQGDGESAWRRVGESWPRLERAMIRRIAMVRVQAHDLRGRAALLAAESSDDGGKRRRRLRRAARDAQRLEREPMPWARAHGALLRAATAALRGRHDQVRAPLELARELFETAGMPIHRLIVERRLAQHFGDTAAVADADVALRELGIRRPDRFAAMLAPGLPG